MIFELVSSIAVHFIESTHHLLDKNPEASKACQELLKPHYDTLRDRDSLRL